METSRVTEVSYEKKIPRFPCRHLLSTIGPSIRNNIYGSQRRETAITLVSDGLGFRDKRGWDWALNP